MLIQTGVVSGTAKRSPGWTLHDGKGPREWSFSVVFDNSFDEPPKIFLAVRLLDAVNKKGADFRFAVQPRFITDSSFSVVASTWSDSQIWSLQVTWIAVDTRFAAQPGSLIQIGIEKFHKNDHGYTLDSGKGERQITRRVQFETRYAGAPQVFTGFAMLDVTNGTGNDFRVESLATEADEFGFGIGAKTCVNSKVWSLQVPWIAVDPRLLRGIPQEDNLVLGSRVKMAVHVAGYTLNRGEGARHIDKNVMFDATFSSPPDVAVFLSGVDILLTTEPEKAANGSDDEEDVDDEEVGLPGATLDIDARIITSDENRSKHGFTLRTATWGDARVWSATSCWLAIGERRPEPVREVEEEEEDEEEEVEAEEAEEEDFLPPRAKLDVKRQLSIPLIAPAEIPVAKKAKVAEEAEPAPKAAPELTDENECKVCMDAVINTVLIPCGHLAACLDCVTLMRSKGNKECPICKQEVASVVKMFKA